MPYKSETLLTGMDASADTSTQLCFNPPEGPFGPGNQVTGTIAHRHDEDWIAIKLTEGNTYTITVMGRATVEDDAGTEDVNEATASMLNDSVLKLMDGKGGLIDTNDDIDGARGMLLSELVFTPEVGSGTQTYFISVSGYAANPGADNTGGYTVNVTGMALLPEGEGADIEGTKYADKLFGTADGESIAGLDGNDTLYGGGGDDSLSGGSGNDLLKGGPGADMLRGGPGDKDTISYAGSPVGVTINLNDGTAMGGDAGGDDVGTDIENIIGSEHDDTLTGTDDASVGSSIWGMGGNDVISGRDGPDMLYGGGGDDMLDGGDEEDTLEGGYGADTLTGGGGRDTVSYAGSMMGVTVRLHSRQAMGGDAEGDIWGDTVTVEYSVPAEDPEDAPVIMEETVPDFIDLTGSHMADILAGDSRDNVIRGLGGDDKIYGGPGGGDDMLHGGGGADMIFGGRGEDTLNGDMGDDMLSGGAGADESFGGGGSDMVYADLMDVADGVLDGGEDMGGLDIDTLSFAKLVDEGVGTATDMFTLGNRNADGEIPADVDAVGFERVIGSDEDDFINGGDTIAEEIEGGDGGDTLVGGTGPGDTVSYENSDRRVRVDLGDGSTDAATGSSASGGHATGDTISEFENIKGSAYGDVLTAVDAGGMLWGLGGDDTLVGGDGDDTIEGGAGADEVDGGHSGAEGEGNTQVNTLSYTGSDAGVTVDLASATASGGHAQGDEIETYEFDTGDEETGEIDVSTFVNVTGSMHGDSLSGDMFDNQLSGGGGDDSLRAGAGADVLMGGPGADRLDGGSSTYDHDNNDATDEVEHEDWAAYRGAVDGVMVNLNTGSGTGGEAMGDTLKNIELIWGSMHDDIFVASAGADIIHGDGGSDTVSYEASKHGVTVTLNNGQFNPDSDGDGTADDPVFTAATQTNVMNWRAGGNDDSATGARPAPVEPADELTTTKSYAEGDVLASIENVTGSRQDDVITGDSTPNVIKGGAGPDRISGGNGNDVLHGGDGNDVIGARAAEDLNGDGNTGGRGEAVVTDEGNDMMYGDAGNDTINGGGGNDTIVGGEGDDDMTGDGGDDTFVFGPGNGSDVISAFVAADDKIDLSAFGIATDDLAGLISERAGNTVINLEAYGGGRVILQDITGLDPTVFVDNDGDGVFEAGGDATDTGDVDGIFIL